MLSIESVKKELADYTAKIEDLNKQLDSLEAQKQNVLRVGTRLEGIVTYLTNKVNELEALAKAEAEKAIAAAKAEAEKVESALTAAPPQS